MLLCHSGRTQHGSYIVWPVLFVLDRITQSFFFFFSSSLFLASCSPQLLLKRHQAEKHRGAPSMGMEYKQHTDTTVFLLFFFKSIYVGLFKFGVRKSRKYSREYCHFDQACDVMNKAGMCGRFVQHVVSQSFSDLCW